MNHSSVYSIPDSTADRSPSINFIARLIFSNTPTFTGIVWYRNIRTEGINANLNTGSFGESAYQPSAADIAALTAAGYTGFSASGADASNTPFPNGAASRKRCSTVSRSEKCDAVVIFSKEVQNEYGLSGQVTLINFRPISEITGQDITNCRGSDV